MFSYLAYVVDYRGFMPQNGDSDLDNAAGTVAAAAAEFQRDDWLFLATGGHNGTEPEGPPSSFFPPVSPLGRVPSMRSSSPRGGMQAASRALSCNSWLRGAFIGLPNCPTCPCCEFST